MLLRLCKSYTNFLIKRPFIAQTTSTAVIMACGDVLAQRVFEDHPYDAVRTLRFGAVGLAFVGPVLAMWIPTVSAFYKSAPLAKIAPLLRMLTDQTFFAPTFIGAFIGVNCLSATGSLQQVRHVLRKDYLDVLGANYFIWPWVQLVNFYVVPLHFRVVFLQCFALVWNVYLAWKTNRYEKTKATPL